MHDFLVAPLGVVVGLTLGAFGAGGSVLTIPALVYAAGQTTRSATTTSLLIVGAAALVGMMKHYRAGRVRTGIGTSFGLAGVGGSVAGSIVNRHLDPNLLLVIFSGFIVVAAWRMLIGRPTCTTAGEEEAVPDNITRSDAGSRSPITPRRQIDMPVLAVVSSGTAIGFLTGVFGVGGGFVVVPALVLLLRLNMAEAIGTSLLVITINSGVALTTRLATTTINWHLDIPFTVAAIAGVIYGSRLTQRLNAQRSLRWFATLLIGLAIYTAARAGTALA